ncbi:MAG: bifunctional 5,10-methylenetetrahydrofolate dehydrogenase/5,10-methenyltetrahydrofolate cyclohydrolase [Solirubrobacteraceae bacterium]|nr:bifunctional 5,10-methylenetetrahydrofolate dehydrogenase/5,10-methenyltetrahydrofolate cyclohydrolase [Solirubrobacteraceae bacterium]
MAELIDGAAVAAEIREAVARDVAGMAVPPGLATVLVGDDPASAIYVARKRRACVEAGMRDLHHHLPGDVSQEELAGVVAGLAADPEVTGILLQLPLPAHLDPKPVLELIPPAKDVDGLTIRSAGRLALGEPGLRPCTPAGVMALLDAYEVPIAGVDAVVVGRSNLVGRPMAQMLLERDATVTSCHKGTADLRSETRRADILVVAAGVPGLIGRDDVKPGVTVIDVGIHRTPDGIVGDVDFAAVEPVASRITPVPGGVGPMTIAMLMRNTVDATRLADELATEVAG